MLVWLVLEVGGERFTEATRRPRESCCWARVISFEGVTGVGDVGMLGDVVVGRLHVVVLVAGCNWCGRDRR